MTGRVRRAAMMRIDIAFGNLQPQMPDSLFGPVKSATRRALATLTLPGDDASHLCFWHIDPTLSGVRP